LYQLAVGLNYVEIDNQEKWPVCMHLEFTHGRCTIWTIGG
jgi:hypothetical protein